MTAARVRGHDGAEEPFDKRRVRAAVERAQAACGASDPQAAGEVADLVELALARRFGTEHGAAHGAAQGAGHGPRGAGPSVAELEDLIEEALVELGHAAVAKAYILERARRVRVKSALDARDAGEDDGRARGPRRAPLVQVAGGVEPWTRARIVAALLDEADLPRALSEDVAARVEERVFASGLKRVSTALVRELVDNELVERGLADALRRTRAVGVPRHDLSRWLATPDPEPEPGAAGPRGLEARVAGAVLSRWAHEDLLSEESAEALGAGEFGLVELERPHLDLALLLPAELVAGAEPGARAAFELLEECARALERTSRALVLEDCGALLAALARAPRGGEERLSGWFLALAALSRASGRAIDLAPRLRAKPAGPLHAPWLERAAQELCELEGGGPRAGLPRLVLDAGDLAQLAASSPALERAVELCLARGRIVPAFGTEGERALGSGLVRRGRERGALALRAAATLNLPRAARRAGPWREDALFEELLAALAHALDALCALRDLRRAQPAAPARARSAFAVVPVGLREALLWLSDGEARPEAAARLLAFLAEAAARLGTERGLSVHLAGAFGERDALRFAALDARRFLVRQPLLFGADAPRAEARGYGAGLDLPLPTGAPSERVEAAADVLAALSSGALEDPRLLRALALPQDGRAPLVLALDALERARARRRSLSTALYALPRPRQAASLYTDAATPDA